MAGVQRQIGDGDTGADHCRLVTHDVDAVEKFGPVPGLTYVEPVDVRRHIDGGAVGLGDERVHADDLVTPVRQLLIDLCSDETAGAGQQNLHLCSSPGPGSSKGRVTSSSQSAQPQCLGPIGERRHHLAEEILEATDVALEQREDLRLVDRLLGARPRRRGR